MALTPSFVAHNSSYIENLLEHRFLFEVGRELLRREPPQLVNILQSEVDVFGVDLVLSAGARTVHLQMKARSGVAKGIYAIPKRLWTVDGAHIIWVLYDALNMDIKSYCLLQLGVAKLSTLDKYPESRKRKSCLAVNLAQQQKIQDMSELVGHLFPMV